MRIIEAEADLAEGVAFLLQQDEWREVLPALLPLPLRRCPDGFTALADVIVGQQISTAAAAAISGRLRAVGLWDETAMAVADEEALRICGLSRSKACYLRGIAAAGIDWRALRALPDEEVIARLVVLPGIGRWTAEIYLKFALGRADAFASGDLALQEAARALFALESRPSARALTLMAEPWRPWRAVAARALWAYYRVNKGREGIR